MSEPFDEQEARFIEHIADGGTLRSAGALLGVSAGLLCKWLADPSRTELREQYARAREAQGDAYADRVIETAENPILDPADKRARIDAYKWAAGKRKPKVYGDKTTLANDPENPVSFVLRLPEVAKSNEEWLKQG